jgi:hypothetical protein
VMEVTATGIEQPAAPAAARSAAHRQHTVCFKWWVESGQSAFGSRLQ